MIVRCQCHGQCGRGGRRGCADPDLTGQCRAESGATHPRSDQPIVITEMQVEPQLWVHVCQDCRRMWEGYIRLLQAVRAVGDAPTLFPEGTS